MSDTTEDRPARNDSEVDAADPLMIAVVRQESGAVWGADLSDEQLRFCREKARAAGASVEDWLVDVFVDYLDALRRRANGGPS